MFEHAEPMGPSGKRDQAESPAAFPAVDGRTLLGANMALPADFPADRTLAVVAFQQRQQSCVDRWIDRAVAAGVPPTTRGATGPIPAAVVEVPVLSTRWRPVRRFIDGGMTRGIGDPDVLHHRRRLDRLAGQALVLRPQPRRIVLATGGCPMRSPRRAPRHGSRRHAHASTPGSGTGRGPHGATPQPCCRAEQSRTQRPLGPGSPR